MPNTDPKFPPLEKVAVIGNGPTELGKGTGPHIDSFEGVVRCNNYRLDGEFAKDYGTRTTHWTNAAHACNLPKTNGWDHILIPMPLYDKRFYRYPTTLAHIPQQDHHKIVYMDYDLYMELFKHLQRPSLGIEVLYWLWRYHGKPLLPQNVFGFTWFDKTQMHEYWDGHIKPDFAKRGEYDHEGAKEKAFFEKMTKEAPR